MSIVLSEKHLESPLPGPVCRPLESSRTSENSQEFREYVFCIPKIRPPCPKPRRGAFHKVQPLPSVSNCDEQPSLRKGVDS